MVAFDPGKELRTLSLDLVTTDAVADAIPVPFNIGIDESIA